MLQVIGAKILINCPVSFQANEFEASYLESLDLASLDFVLVTDSLNALALPFLLSNPLFKGKVLATDPVFEFAVCLVKDLVFDCEIGNLYSSSQESFKYRYIEEHAKLLAKRVTPVKYGQRINWFNMFTIFAVASGYEIGGTAWRIESGSEFSISIVGSASLEGNTSDNCAQIQPSLNVNALKHSNFLLLLKEPSKYSFSASDYRDNLIKVICKAKQLTASSGKKIVIFPSLAAGRIVFDLLETFCQFYPLLDIFLLSSMGRRCMNQLDISTEWLHASMQEKVYTGEEKPLKCTSSTSITSFSAFDQHFASKLEGILGKGTLLIFCTHPSKQQQVGNFYAVYNFFSNVFSPSEIAILETDSRFDSCISSGIPTDKHWLDPHLSLKDICELVKQVKSFSKNLHVINISFKHAYQEISNCFSLEAECSQVEIPIETSFHSSLAEKSLIPKNSPISLLKCTLDQQNNLIYLKSLSTEQEITHNIYNYSCVHAPDSFFFSSTRIFQLFTQFKGKVEFYKQNERLCISINQGEAVIESEDGILLRISSNSAEMLSQVQQHLLSN